MRQGERLLFGARGPVRRLLEAELGEELLEPLPVFGDVAEGAEVTVTPAF